MAKTSAKKEIQITVRLDAAAFQDFALFDALRMKKSWKRPLLFASIFLLFACISFAVSNVNNQGVFMGVFLLVIGLGLPLVYFGHFFLSVRQRGRMLGTDKPRYVYKVGLQENGVTHAPSNAQTKITSTPWGSVYGAWKTAGAVYLYITPAQAYLLPNGQGSASDERIWAFLQDKLGESKCHLVKE